MSKPKKATVDYFPHYVDHGKTLYNVEAIYGNDGYAFWFKLLELLGKTENHYYDCNEAGEWRYLLSYSRFDEQKANDILELLAELKAIDYDLWKMRIVYSEKFIDNLQQLYSRRGATPYTKTELMGLLHTNNRVSGESDVIYLQSKVKESKVKESKVKESKVKESKVNNTHTESKDNVTETLQTITKLPPKKPYGEFNNVLLTDDEHAKVIAKPKGNQAIERLSSYLASTGKKYKSHYATINSWVYDSLQEKKNGYQKEVQVPAWYGDYEKQLKYKNRPKEKVSVDLEALEKSLDETFKTQK